jgi:hypothetical protein
LLSAFVILHPDRVPKWAGRHDVFAEELKNHVRKTLPGFARPEWVAVVNELPVSVFFIREKISPMHRAWAENIDRKDIEGEPSHHRGEIVGRG